MPIPATPRAMVLRAAAGIANERGGRRGMPPIANVLDLLPEKLREEVTDDAKAALDNCGVPDLIEALRQILGWRGTAFGRRLSRRPGRGERTQCDFARGMEVSHERQLFLWTMCEIRLP